MRIKGRMAALAAAALTAAAMMGTGVFASEALSAKDVLTKMTEAQKQEKCGKVTVDLGLNAGFEITGDSEMTVGLSADSSAVAEYDLRDGFEGSVKADASVSAAGQNMSMKIETYAEKDGEEYKVYSKTDMDEDEGEWETTSVPAEEIEKLLAEYSGSEASLELFDKCGIEFASDLKDGEYVLTAELDGEDVENIMNEVMKEATKQEELQAAATQAAAATPFLEGIKLNMEIKADAETFLPKEMSFDMTKSDLDKIGTLFAEGVGVEASNVKVTLEKAEVKAVYSFDETNVEIPDEAKDAEKNDAQAAA